MLYLVAMLRPIMPFLDYMVNYDYIAEALCENRDKPYLECNGKCYLEKELAAAGHDNHEHNSTVPKINFEDYPISLIDLEHSEEENLSELRITSFSYCNLTFQEVISAEDKPPALVL